MSIFTINLHQAVYSLSDALDLVGVTHIHHGKRVAYMAAECGKFLNWPSQRLDDLYVAAMLHDCGVSKTIVHSNLTQMEWENENEHCVLGESLLKQCEPLAYLSGVIRHHHAHWSVLQHLDLPIEVKLAANCIFLADRVDILTVVAMGKQPNILLCRDDITAQIVARKGDWFCPEFVDAFVNVAVSEAFWFCLEREQVDAYALTWTAHESKRQVDFKDVRSLVNLFSFIVDAKSPFTAEHSIGVGRLARYLGEQMELPEKSCDTLELAGLLHDLGKLRVPDQYIEKPGRLTQQEYSMVQRHSFDTYNVLKNIPGFEEVALWTSQHHERLDGSGYPYHLCEAALSLEARIVAVADVFQAVSQNRPYRNAMPPDEVLGVLQEDAAAGKLDKQVVACVEKNLGTCWHIAIDTSDTAVPV
jgi:HD-GYP domain-containing protein (c-di-GMP phosphodiesterase class II)